MQRVEDNLSNLTLDMNQRFDQVNFNVNQVLEKLEEVHKSFD